jgi:hypothetical protein
LSVRLSGGHLSEEAQEARRKRLIRRNSTLKFSKEAACPSYIYIMKHIPNKVQVCLQALLLSSSLEAGEGRKMIYHVGS